MVGQSTLELSQLQPFIINLFAFFFIISKSTIKVLQALQYFTNFKPLLKLFSISSLGCAIFNLKAVYQFKFGKNKVFFTCRRKEYASLMRACDKKLAPWPSGKRAP